MKKQINEIIEKKFTNISKALIQEQLKNFYQAKENYVPKNNEYKIGEQVYLKKGTLLHGTYLNYEGLKEIIKNDLLASYFIDGRLSKYPGCVGVWNLKQDYYLKDYIDFYSGGTIRYNNMGDAKTETQVIPYSKMKDIMKIITEKHYQRWYMEQTKEARFMPSLVQDKVQVGVIINADNEYIKKLKEKDILNEKMTDEECQDFVDKNYYENFITKRQNKDDFFTDRESAIILGIPKCLIEGILVGRIYENDKKILEQIKKLMPNCYICNLDGKVIY